MPDSPNPDPKNIRQNIDEVRGGNVIGEQHNYYTPPSNPPQPRKSGFPWGTLFQVLVAVLGLLLAFLALYPEDSRTELFRNLGLLPIPTATLTPLPTETPTMTLAPSETPSPTYTEAAIPALTSATTDAPVVTNIPPAVTNTPPAIPVPAYPCDGQIVFTTGALLNQVKVTPLKGAPPGAPVQQGSPVSILAKQVNEGIVWYQIRYDNDTKTGWIPEEYVTPSQSCPA